MPRTRPCRVCQRPRLIGRGSKSRPLCRECRAAARGVRERRAHVALVLQLLIGEVSSVPVEGGWADGDRRPSTTERGYGADHQRIRRRALEELIEGTPCPRCQEPMTRDQALDLDHTDDRSGYLGLSHAACNRRRNRRPRKLRLSVPCETCGIPFPTPYEAQRFCSRACRRNQPRAPRGKAGIARPPRPERPCRICGTGTTGVLCSSPCRKEAGRRASRDRYRAAVGIPVDPAQPTKRWAQ